MTSYDLTVAATPNGKPELLKHPFNMIICGPSGSGKTTFIHSLLRNLDAITSTKFSRIIYAYGIFQPLYREIAQLPNVQMVEGYPSDLAGAGEQRTLLILDDLFLETDKNTAALFTRLRHLNMSTIFVTHNFFHECKYMRTVTRNSHYLVFFRNPRDAGQVAHLSRQMYPGNGKFLPDALKMATRQPYSCLFIDLKPETEESLRVMSGVLPHEDLFYYRPA